VFAWIKKTIAAVWKWIEAWTQFLDDSKGKFSHKRLLALAFGVVAIRQVIISDYFGAIILAAAAVILAVVSAITKT
jgi:hypothetical protein